MSLSPANVTALEKISSDLNVSLSQACGICLDTLKELAKQDKKLSPKAKFVLESLKD